MPLPKVWNDYDRLDAADLNADMAYLDANRYGELAITNVTASVSLTATTEATAQVIATLPGIACDGATPLEIEFQSVQVSSPSAAGASTILVLFMDGVSLGRWATVQSAAAGSNIPVRVVYRATPAAGSRVFSVRGYVSSGTGTVLAGTGGAGQLLPAYLRARRI